MSEEVEAIPQPQPKPTPTEPEKLSTSPEEEGKKDLPKPEAAAEETSPETPAEELQESVEPIEEHEEIPSLEIPSLSEVMKDSDKIIGEARNAGWKLDDIPKGPAREVVQRLLDASLSVEQVRNGVKGAEFDKETGEFICVKNGEAQPPGHQSIEDVAESLEAIAESDKVPEEIKADVKQQVENLREHIKLMGARTEAFDKLREGLEIPDDKQEEYKKLQRKVEKGEIDAQEAIDIIKEWSSETEAILEDEDKMKKVLKEVLQELGINMSADKASELLKKDEKAKERLKKRSGPSLFNILLLLLLGADALAQTAKTIDEPSR